MSNIPRSALLVVVLALIGSSQAGAQTIIGFHLGGSAATISTDDIDFKSKFGLKIGGSATFPVNANLTVKTGLDYAKKGAEYSDSNFNEALAIDYVELPLMLRYAIPVSGMIAPHVAVGPALGFKVGCEFTAEVQGATPTSPCADEGLDAHSIDVSIVAGAGFSYPVSDAIAATVDVQYGFGLTNIDTGDDPVDAVNRAFSFLLGIELPIGR